MNTKAKAKASGRQTSASARRVVPAIGIVTLAIGLGACQTPPQRAAAPYAPVMQHAEVPAGVDMWRPADRLIAQLEYEALLTLRSQAANSEESEDALVGQILERLHRVNAGMRVE